MNTQILDILKMVQEGTLSPDEAMLKLRMEPFEDLGFAKVDHHRSLRQGTPEIIYGDGKTSHQICEIVESLRKSGTDNVLITRVDSEKGSDLLKNIKDSTYDEVSKICKVGSGIPRKNGYVVVLTAGTSDIPVAEEAAQTCEFLGNNVERVYDVGVSGIHRLFAKMDTIMGAEAIIVVAGMEGALASVVGGLVDRPVIGVPTSVGYGATYEGITALLTMINSCASCVSVVNIDNGFGAGYIANMINRK